MSPIIVYKLIFKMMKIGNGRRQRTKQIEDLVHMTKRCS